MLQKFNERIQGVVAWVIVGVIAITFALFGADSYLQAHHASAAEAEVDGKPISKHAFELQYRRVRQAQESSGSTDGAEQQLKRQILDDMIASFVNVRAAHAYGFGLDTEQANAAILRIPQFQKDGQFSPERYQQALSNALFTAQSFQEEVRQGMLLNQQRFAFMGTAFALPEEVAQFVKLYGQTRDYRYARISTAAFAKGIQVSSDEIKTYYDAHTGDFLMPEQVRLEFIKLSMADVRDGFKSSMPLLRTYYENNQANYMAPARWYVRHVLFETPKDASKEDTERASTRAEAFYQQVQFSPDAFEIKGKVVSQEKSSTVTAGVLPWILAGESTFDSELVNLTKEGQVLSPIKTDAGYEVFQLISYEPTKLKPFDDVKNDVREHWLAERAQAEYARLLEELADLSYQTPDSLVAVSDAVKQPIIQTGLVTRDGGDSPVTLSPQALQAAFSHDVLTLGNNSTPIQLDDDAVIVLRVREHIPAREKPLRDVQGEIKKQVLRDKAHAHAVALGESLLKQHEGGLMDDAFLLTHRLAWQSVTQATRDSSLAPAEVNDLAFTLSKKNPRAGRALPDDAGYVVVELRQVIDGKLSMLDREQVESISQQIGANYGAIDYDLYVSQLLDQAKIVRH
jgi:peptidyl-prolyl cis-trans isomerase D